MKRAYVLIVNWNGWQDTIECLESVFRLDYPDYRVIVCDNGSTDDSCDRILAWANGQPPVPADTRKKHHLDLIVPPVKKPLSCAVYGKEEAEAGGRLSFDPALTLIRTGENLGFAGGNNVGLKYALARDEFNYVWLLNNDTVVESGALQALVQRMSTKSSAGICGSTLVRYDEPERIQARGGGWYCKWIGLPWHLGQLEKVAAQPRLKRVEKWMNYVVGASMLVSRDFLVDVGLMCEDYFLFFEEADWALRGKKKYGLAYASNSIVYHKVGASIGTSTDPRKKSLVCDYYSTRNRIRFTLKHYPIALLTVYPALCCAVLFRLILGQWDRGGMILRLMLARGKDLGNMKPGE